MGNHIPNNPGRIELLAFKCRPVNSDFRQFSVNKVKTSGHKLPAGYQSNLKGLAPRNISHNVNSFNYQINFLFRTVYPFLRIKIR